MQKREKGKDKSKTEEEIDEKKARVRLISMTTIYHPAPAAARRIHFSARQIPDGKIEKFVLPFFLAQSHARLVRHTFPFHIYAM